MLHSFVAFTEICGGFAFPWNQKKNCLLFLNSPSPLGSNPHLKWLSKGLKAPQGSRAGLFSLTLTQQPRADAAYSTADKNFLVYNRRRTSRNFTSDEFISQFTTLNLWSSQRFWIPKLQWNGSHTVHVFSACNLRTSLCIASVAHIWIYPQDETIYCSPLSPPRTPSWSISPSRQHSVSHSEYVVSTARLSVMINRWQTVNLF